MIHATEKSIADLGDKVEADEKAAAEAAIAELKEVIQGEDKEAIEAKTTALTEIASKIAEKAYAQSAEAEAGGNAAGEQDAEAGEEVVDAEFEEVKDDNSEK